MLHLVSMKQNSISIAHKEQDVFTVHLLSNSVDALYDIAGIHLFLFNQYSMSRSFMLYRYQKILRLLYMFEPCTFSSLLKWDMNQ